MLDLFQAGKDLRDGLGVAGENGQERMVLTTWGFPAVSGQISARGNTG
jgi:hypothetical protein